MENYITDFLTDTAYICHSLNTDSILDIVVALKTARDNNGRLFILGVGGSAANASHAVNDFRKIAGIEAYCPTDNVSELTARINDDGWNSAFVNWLKVNKLSSNDIVMIFSVGGGDEIKKISVNLVDAMRYAKQCKSKILGIVGRDGGFTATIADNCVIIPSFDLKTITPQVEAFHGIILHVIVTHPLLKLNDTKWESTK